MTLALKTSQRQEESQKVHGPCCPVSLLQAPQKWEVMGEVFLLGTCVCASRRATLLYG